MAEHKGKKSPQQRAQEALDVAERRVERLRAKRDKAEADRERFDAELNEALRRLEYAEKHPDLPLPDEYQDPRSGSDPGPEF